MTEPGDSPSIELSIVITVVDGAEAVRRCLAALAPQLRDIRGEVIVPYDRYSPDVENLAGVMPALRLLHVDRLGLAENPDVPSHEHRLFDRRRAVGLAQARGRIVAMTEDRAVPAPDWCARILEAHREPFAAIGGAIENAVNRLMNWAIYYCDFGRYGRPFARREAPPYVSDVNVSYKREALEAVRELWINAYQETTVHWAMRERGLAFHLDPTILVRQHRPPVGLLAALRERLHWGRVFAETRARAIGGWHRLGRVASALLLPIVLTFRALRLMLRHGRSAYVCLATLPLLLILQIAWSLGELFGYASGPPPDHTGSD